MSKYGWNVYCTRFLVRARQLTEPLAFTDPLGHQHVGSAGDYLVETSNGIRRIASREFFEDTYLFLEPEPHAELEMLHPSNISEIDYRAHVSAPDRHRASA